MNVTWSAALPVPMNYKWVEESAHVNEGDGRRIAHLRDPYWLVEGRVSGLEIRLEVSDVTRHIVPVWRGL